MELVSYLVHHKFHPHSNKLGNGIVSGTLNKLINKRYNKTIVNEIDNDEIPIDQIGEDAITISGTSVTLGGVKITDETLFGGTGVVTGPRTNNEYEQFTIKSVQFV